MHLGENLPFLPCGEEPGKDHRSDQTAFGNYPLPGPGQRFQLEGVDDDDTLSPPMAIGSLETGQVACSDAFSETFEDAAVVFLSMGVFELIVACLSCGLICTARCFRAHREEDEFRLN